MRIINRNSILLILYFSLFFSPLFAIPLDKDEIQDQQKKIKQTLQLAIEIQYEHPNKAFRMRKEMLPLAKKAKDKNILAYAYSQIIFSYYNFGKFDSASMYCDTVFSIPDIQDKLLAKVSIIHSVCSRRLGEN